MSMWQPVKTDNKTEYIFILRYTKNNIEKEILKKQKAVTRASIKLRDMDPFTTTKKRRSNARLSLEAACEARDRWEKRLEIVNNLLAGESLV
ncbi:hypothetical protein SH1V18_15110 [Vallitalea longa]|uniref:Uncharacterized protein n=1 Tax=Vallitalea longa TaxID=2936439 RepID=A0A9W5YAB7_9FIRM|nr:hypothetical protein [Vallitalea longa]GKX29031.1 hypothetical protein SH1V18_15110 [Vallitalea longa]